MNFVAFDLETTGTKPRLDRIVEIGAVRFEAGRAVEGFGTLVDPGVPIPPDASAVNGITGEMVRGQPRIGDVLAGFSAFCGELPLVAHNAPFDFKFLLEAVEANRAAAPAGAVVDTLALSRLVFPGLPNYKLWTLARHFAFPGGTFHRAQEDSAHCGLLFGKILDALERRGEPCSEADLVRLGGTGAMRFPRYTPQPAQLDLF